MTRGNIMSFATGLNDDLASSGLDVLHDDLCCIPAGIGSSGAHRHYREQQLLAAREKLGPVHYFSRVRGNQGLGLSASRRDTDDTFGSLPDQDLVIERPTCAEWIFD